MIDTHCHLFKDDYQNIEEIISHMKDNFMIVSGINDDTNLEVINLVNKYPNVYGVIGIHPEEISNIKENSFKIIEENINNPKIVGIGEIGLDYYWNKDDKLHQQEIFIKQILLANKYHKTIVIHSRDAINDTYNILEKYLATKAVMHCYSSSLDMAYKFIKLGLKIGVGGVITFKNSKSLKEVVENVSLDDILLETDSPYLTPEPYRGRKNEPCNIFYIANKIAEIKNTSIEEIFLKTSKNAIDEFDLPINL